MKGRQSIWSGLAAVALGLLQSACSSVKAQAEFSGVKVEGGETPVEVVDVYNTNWLFLSLACLPVASGDPDNPDGWTTRFFRNTVTLENQLKMLENEVKRVGARKAIDVTTTSTDESLLWILFLREKYHTSAVLVK